MKVIRDFRLYPLKPLLKFEWRRKNNRIILNIMCVWFAQSERERSTHMALTALTAPVPKNRMDRVWTLWSQCEANGRQAVVQYIKWHKHAICLRSAHVRWPQLNAWQRVRIRIFFIMWPSLKSTSNTMRNADKINKVWANIYFTWLSSIITDRMNRIGIWLKLIYFIYIAILHQKCGFALLTAGPVMQWSSDALTPHAHSTAQC